MSRRSATMCHDVLRLSSVSVTKDDGAPVARVTLERPAAHNVLNLEMLCQIEDAFLHLKKEHPDVRVIVLSGRGKSFSEGHELAAASSCVPMVEAGAMTKSARCDQRGARAVQAIANSDAITIARVQGHAIGGGFSLMQGCDLRCVTADAVLYATEFDVGNPAPWGLGAMLARDVGLPVAMELMLMRSELPASRAHELGLVNRVCHGEAALDETVNSLAHSIATKPVGALAFAKAQMRSLRHSGVPSNKLGPSTDSPAHVQARPSPRLQLPQSSKL